MTAMVVGRRERQWGAREAGEARVGVGAEVLQGGVVLAEA
jgi:hypothetical protein